MYVRRDHVVVLLGNSLEFDTALFGHGDITVRNGFGGEAGVQPDCGKNSSTSGEPVGMNGFHHVFKSLFVVFQLIVVCE